MITFKWNKKVCIAANVNITKNVLSKGETETAKLGDKDKWARLIGWHDKS